MEKILLEVLQETRDRNNRALQVLRENFGFDYNKPIKAVKFKESFTPTSLKNLYGIDVKNMSVAVLFKRGKWFETADYSDGEVNLLCSMYPLTSVSTKTEFNEYRKDGYLDCYVIAQDRKYVLSCFVDSAKLDVDQRFVSTSYRYCYKLDSARKPQDRIYCYKDELDVSGYPVEVKREYLRSKAKAIREKRDEEAYKAMTNTQDMISRARKAIEAKQVELSKKIAVVSTYKEAVTLNNSMNRLTNCFYDLEEIQENDKNKWYSSPQSFYRAVKCIYSRLEEI